MRGLDYYTGIVFELLIPQPTAGPTAGLQQKLVPASLLKAIQPSHSTIPLQKNPNQPYCETAEKLVPTGLQSKHAMLPPTHSIMLLQKKYPNKT